MNILNINIDYSTGNLIPDEDEKDLRRLPCSRLYDHHFDSHSLAISVVIPELTSGGDYGITGYVGITNYKAFVEEFGDHPDVYYLYGSWGTYAIAIKSSCTDEGIINFYNKLEDYPCADDDLLTEVEDDAKLEAWNNWIRKSFLEGVNSHLTMMGAFDCPLEDMDIRGFFDEMCGKYNEYIEPDGNDMWIDLKKLFSKIQDQDYKDWFEFHD